MRVNFIPLVRTRRPRSAVTGLTMYGLMISSMCFALASLTGALVRSAEGPVSGLMQLGDAAAADVVNASAPIVRTAVLEGDAWLQNLRSEYQGRDRSRSKGLPGGSGLFGAGGADMVSPRSGDSLNDNRSSRADSQGAHRTVCVRLCDGYFWPISFATSGENFERDQAVCENSCSSPAKLYVYENPGQESEQMVSLKGQPYTKLSTAFQFRTKLDQSCKCNAHPWEQEAVDRHRKYAEEAEKKKLIRKAEIDLGVEKDVKPAKGKKAVKAVEAVSEVNVTAAVSVTSPVADVAVLNPLTPAEAKPPANRGRLVPGPAFVSAGVRQLPSETTAGEMIVANSNAGVVGEVQGQTESSKPRAMQKVNSPASQRVVAAKPAASPTSNKVRVPEGQMMRLGTGHFVPRGSLQPAARDWRVAIFTPRDRS